MSPGLLDQIKAVFDMIGPYHEDFLANEALPDEDERKLPGALIATSTGVEDVSKLNVPVEVGRRLIQCSSGIRKVFLWQIGYKQ